MSDILIVIPTYKHFEYALMAVKSAMSCTHQLKPHVLVVDDATPHKFFDAQSIAAMQEVIGKPVDQWLKIFPSNGGLTRSWNFGISIASERRYTYCCVTNSDVVFAPGWDIEIVNALQSGIDLVGPVTNAPGTNTEQYVGRYAVTYNKVTAEKDIEAVQRELSAVQKGRVKPTTLNGFCLIAKTQTWCDNAFELGNAFRPRNDFNSKGQPNPTPLMTLNEYELQKRWHAAGLKTAAALGSYVFHYRAVSRGDAFKKGDWIRLKEAINDRDSRSVSS